MHHTRRRFLAISAGAVALAAGIATPILTRAGGGYSGGERIPGTPVFTGGTYVAPADDALYQYGQDEAGTAYYTTYADGNWSGWQAYQNQAAPVAYDPAPVAYDGKAVVYYTGKDGYLYEQGWDSYGDATWTDVSGDYTYDAAPAATTYESSIHLYGAASDGYVYHKAYDDAEWSAPEPVNETPAKGGTKPYAFTWGAKDSVFWLGDDGYAYWNRYSHAEGTWAGAKQIPSDYTFAATPYAVSDDTATSVYAYSVNDAGAPVRNTFDGEGWSGWEAFEADWTASYQPSVYAADGTQHVVYTADGGNAYYNSYDGSAWSGWQDLGGNYGYDTQQYAYEGTQYLTYTGQDGGIYYKTYGADGGGAQEPTPTPKVKY
jgi:hypothetical protein